MSKFNFPPPNEVFQGMAQDEGEMERLWNFLNDPLEVPPALTISGNNGFWRNKLEDRTSYVLDADLDDPWSMHEHPPATSPLPDTQANSTSNQSATVKPDVSVNPSDTLSPPDPSGMSPPLDPSGTLPLTDLLQGAPKKAFNIFSGASGASIPLIDRATLPSGSVHPIEGQLAQGNSATWASRNPTRRTLPVRPPPQPLTDAAKASRSIVRKVKNNMLKKLNEDIITFVKEQNNKITDIAKNHDVKVEKVKNMVIAYTHYTKAQKLQLHNAILHAKALEINPSTVTHEVLNNV
ncbi:hypothetical protein SERLA73DRAFT_79952 [Serpula lacrymans var. lacrymans S7.3]|uniref:Uncharacterized protein n=2 Tax=Serpula lacrymans var. lacrymans TaxID=341189 RepID=F8QI61_SERL3|nr:uncharacterized protein SERLADRAFT_444135 [Serpula lacrymans var. lacrymans S7.9]EGN91997.1 hypothetical protein SERLA73DRAFT_79952 [Serpula lacrymans var. lacrymans S7.3]EGO18416.1 hypothetical protein SERLADRAFT_444135 [Serpula lacrymans var. lacrymans S7.9]